MRREVCLKVDEAVKNYFETQDEFYMLKIVDLTLKYFRNEVNYLLNNVNLNNVDIRQEVEQCLTLFILQSVKNYDIKTNIPFVYFIRNTYLFICIKTVNHLLSQYKTSKHIKIKKEINKLIEENPNLSLQQIIEIYSENNKHHKNTIEYSLQGTQLISLETPLLDTNEEITLKDILVSEDSVENNVYQKQLKKIIEELINELDEREKYIINYRFGIGDYEVKTLEEIGNELNLSKERVRQLENKILNKLSNILRKKGVDKQNLYDILL